MATIDTLQDAVNTLTSSTTELLDEVQVNKSTLETSATNAAGSASDAATSASNASSSASSASTSATQAGNSATQAAASAASANQIVTGVASGRPSIRPTLNLDFANSKTLDPRITFTRSSTATYYDGKTTVKAEENVEKYSQELAANWGGSNNTLLDDATVAPDGTTTATKITPSTDNDTHYIKGSTVPGTNGYSTHSVYAKSDGNYHLQLRPVNTGSSNYWATFDLVNGTVGNSGGNYLSSANIVDVGNGWYRCSVSYYNMNATHQTSIFVSHTGSSAELPAFAGDDSKHIFVWGFQVEYRDSDMLTAYTPTSGQAITNYIPVLQTAASGEARFDHDPITGESKGLLIEEQRTNLLARSENFSNAVSWIQNKVHLDSNTIVAPDGTLSGTKMIPDTAGGQHIRTTLSATGVTFSVYAKAAELSYLDLGDTAYYTFAVFDLTNGTATVGVNGNTAGIEDVGNGWYRCWAYTSSSITEPRIYTQGNDYDSIQGIYIWGAQLEVGSFPTSYIPTSGSQVTRSKDEAKMLGTNFSDWYRQDEGTMYANYISSSSENAAAAFSLDNGSTTQRIILFNDNSNSSNATASFITTYNGSSSGSVSFGNSALNSQHKMAGAYKVNDYGGSFDNDNLGTDSTGAVPIVNRAIIGNSSNGGHTLNGHIKKVAYYPARLSNSELQALTED
jgi:hypothetical protein